MTKSARLVTLETFIIDTFTRIGQDGSERPCGEIQMGGGGTYAIIGSRIFLPAGRLGMIIDHTPDTLPIDMRQALEHFGSDMWYVRERNDGHGTTWAVNRYTGDVRVFEYLTPARYLLPIDLLDTPWTDPPPSTIHLISDARRLETFEQDMSAVRNRFGADWDPKIVWEPEPYDNVPECLDMFRRLVPLMDVVSPNHTEALTLLSLSPLPSRSLNDDPHTLTPLLEQAALMLLDMQPKLGVVIRCGALGACYVTRFRNLKKGESPLHADDSQRPTVHWIPSFYQQSELDPDGHTKVVDPTGAGNGFMGALGAALDTGLDLREAVIWGTVAASFIIEQDGLPTLTYNRGKELWNGCDPLDRVDEMHTRLRNGAVELSS